MALITHAGARIVTRGELDSVQAPTGTATWFPLAHGQVIGRVEQQLQEAGFSVASAKYALARGDHRMFAVLDTQSALGSGVTLAVGVRNSTDRSLPIGFIAGHHVFVCDNMAFRSEILVVRKHTKNGAERFVEALAKAIQRLSQWKDEEARRVRRLQGTLLLPERRDSIILQAFEEGIISTRQLPAVISQAKRPDLDYGVDANSAWTLLQAFTYVMQDVLKSNAQRFAHCTMKLQSMLDTRLLPAPEVNGGAA